MRSCICHAFVCSNNASDGLCGENLSPLRSRNISTRYHNRDAKELALCFSVQYLEKSTAVEAYDDGDDDDAGAGEWNACVVVIDKARILHAVLCGMWTNGGSSIAVLQ